MELRPGLPRRDGVFQPCLDLGLGPDLGRAALGPRAVMEGEARAFAAAELELAGDRRRVDGQGHRGRERHHVGAPERDHSTVDGIEQGMDQPVLRTRNVLHGQIDLAFDARGPAQQDVWRIPAEIVPPVAVAHGQRVGDGDRTRRREEGGLQHHGAVQIAPGHLSGPGGPDRPVAGLVIEEATEDRWAVEAGEAQPVDRTVPAHQRSAVPIREERIVGYGDCAHVSSFACTSAGSESGSSGAASVPPIVAGPRGRRHAVDLPAPASPRRYLPSGPGETHLEAFRRRGLPESFAIQAIGGMTRR